MKPCILLSTCDRYRPLAEFTSRAIQEQWTDHPEVFVSGLSSTGENHLPLEDPPRDWMAVTRSACSNLLERGFDSVYLLLEDHPPLGRCNATALNEELPHAMAQLDATSLALSGYGQRRATHGKVVRAIGKHFDHVPVSQLWKFPLHPALWNLERLAAILDQLIEKLPENEHTPWAFERVGGNPKSDLPLVLKASSYRIDGLEWTVGSSPHARRLPLAAFQFLGDVGKFFVRVGAGAEAREAWDRKLRWLYCWYDGPYPLFWSGAMQKGQPNQDLLRFLRASGQYQLANSLTEAMAACK